MPHSNRSESIKETLIGYINDETGILLESSLVRIEASSTCFTFLHDDIRIASVEYSEDDNYSDEDVACMLLENAGNIRKVLIQQKIEMLSTYVMKDIEMMKEHFLEFLSEEEVEDLNFEITDMGYNSKHYDVEPGWGYPEICLNVSDFDDIAFSFPLNIYFPEEALDIKDAYNQIDSHFNS